MSNNYTCLHDYVVELDLSFLPFSHRYGYSNKCHSMTFVTTMVYRAYDYINDYIYNYTWFCMMDIQL